MRFQPDPKIIALARKDDELRQALITLTENLRPPWATKAHDQEDEYHFLTSAGHFVAYRIDRSEMETVVRIYLVTEGN